MNTHCQWCGKIITKEQDNKYSGCCDEEHLNNQMFADSCFILDELENN